MLQMNIEFLPQFKENRLTFCLRLDGHKPHRLESWKFHRLHLNDLVLLAGRHCVLRGKEVVVCRKRVLVTKGLHRECEQGRVFMSLGQCVRTIELRLS